MAHCLPIDEKPRSVALYYKCRRWEHLLKATDKYPTEGRVTTNRTLAGNRLAALPPCVTYRDPSSDLAAILRYSSHEI
jgi:hypothetical protein